MVRPASNLPGPAEQWRRAIEDEQDAQAQLIELLTSEIARLATSDGGVAALMAKLNVGDVATLYSQLKALYTLTGNVYPPVAAAPPPPPAVPTYTTIEPVAPWSATWGSYTSAPYSGGIGTAYTDSQMMYQGDSQSKIAIAGVSMGSAANKNIVDMQIFLQNTNFPWSSGGTAALGLHGYSSPPSQKPNRNNGWDVGWGEGEGKWTPIPPQYWSGFSNGGFQGISVGGIGPNTANSAIFMGVGKSNPPRYKITYQN